MGPEYFLIFIVIWSYKMFLKVSNYLCCSRHSQILKFSRVFDQSASGGFFFSLLDFKCPLWLVRRKQKIRFHNRELPCREEDQWKEKKNQKKSRQIAYNFSNSISHKPLPHCVLLLDASLFLLSLCAMNQNAGSLAFFDLNFYVNATSFCTLCIDYSRLLASFLG